MATLTRKPLNWFKTAPQSRRHFDETELRLLGESLKVKQLQPVLAKPDGLLIAGERRLRAAFLAEIADLWVVITEEALTQTEVQVFQMMENTLRADLGDAEKWRACEELLRLNPTWTNKDLAQHLKLSEPTVTKYLAPSRCAKDVQEALESGRIGITTAYEISRADVGQHTELLRLKEAGASRDGLAEHLRKQRKAATPQVRAKRIVCPLPSGMSVTVTGQDLSLDDLIEALGDAQKEARKAREQKLCVKSFQNVMRDKSRAV